MRKDHLLKLVEIHHRVKHGDYRSNYEEFSAQYLEDQRAHIPRYASIASDETYGMISLHETITEAISAQADIPESGEYLNVPAGVYDLEDGSQVRYKLVALTEAAYATLCGLVQPNDQVNHAGIFSSSWEELRETFPLADFKEFFEMGDSAYEVGNNIYYEDA